MQILTILSFSNGFCILVKVRKSNPGSVKFWERKQCAFTSWANILKSDFIMPRFCVKASITNSEDNTLKKNCNGAVELFFNKVFFKTSITNSEDNTLKKIAMELLNCFLTFTAWSGTGGWIYSPGLVLHWWSSFGRRYRGRDHRTQCGWPVHPQAPSLEKPELPVGHSDRRWSGHPA